MDEVDDSDAPAKVPQPKKRTRTSMQVVVEVPPRQSVGSSTKRVLQESPTTTKTSTKRTRVSDRDEESESGIGEKTPVQQSKWKGKGKLVEEKAPAKRTRARAGPETKEKAVEGVALLDLGNLTVEEGSIVDPKLVPGVEKMVCLFRLA